MHRGLIQNGLRIRSESPVWIELIQGMMVMRSIIDIHDIGWGPGYLIKGEKGRWRK